MGRSKIEYGGEVLIDLTNDTTTAETTLAGYTGHSADGEPFVGTMAAGANITSGADVPSADMGSDGDYYIKEESQEEVTSETIVQDENTLLLLHGESLTDSSIYNVPITNNGVTVSTAQSKFGGSSLYFNGNNCYLRIPLDTVGIDINSDWSFDWWEYLLVNKSTKSAIFYISTNSTARGFFIGCNSGEDVRIFGGDTNWNFLPVTTVMGTYIGNTWVHRAACKKGSVVYGFENGQKILEVNVGGTISLSGYLYIGYRATETASGSINGYLDEIRISNIARWTENFTPSTEPYTVESTITTTNTVPIVAELYNKKQGLWEKIMTGATGGRVVYNAKLSSIWSGDLPYTQIINLDGILSTDTPHITPIYGNNVEDEAQAWSLVTRAVTSDGGITFYCYGDKPTINLNLQIEVIR